MFVDKHFLTSVFFNYRHEPRHDKTNELSVCPAKTQISLGIRPVWTESSLGAWRKLRSLATHWAHSEDSDQTGRMPRLILVFTGCTVTLLVVRGAWWLSGRVSDSGARGRGFETYRRCVVSLSKTLYSPEVLVNYPGSGGSVPTWLKNCWLGRLASTQNFVGFVMSRLTCSMFSGSRLSIYWICFQKVEKMTWTLRGCNGDSEMLGFGFINSL